MVAFVVANPDASAGPVALSNTTQSLEETAAELATGVPSHTASPAHTDFPAVFGASNVAGEARQQISPLDVTAPWGPARTFMYATEPTAGVTEIKTIRGWLPPYSTDGMPATWGLEIGVRQINPAILGPGRPTCLPQNNFRDLYWAARNGAGPDSINSWSVTTSNGTPIDHDTIGAYYDWNTASDECQDQTMSVGIAFPANISENSAGVQVVKTTIRTDRGSVDSSWFEGGYDAVFNDCSFPAQSDVLPPAPDYGPSSWCMGLSTAKPWPGPGTDYLLFVNEGRNLTLPTCTETIQDKGTGTPGLPAVYEISCP